LGAQKFLHRKIYNKLLFWILMFHLFERPKKIKNKPFNLVLSGSPIHGNTLKIAKRLESSGIDVLLTCVGWPRDEMLFFPDGTYIHNQKATIQGECLDHRAWVGGEYLRGIDFILATSSMPPSKRRGTVRVCGALEGFFYDIGDGLDALKNIQISGNQFYGRDILNHIDVSYNIGNFSRKVFTYAHKELLKVADQMRRDCGYDIVELPLEDARFASVGFVEIGEAVVIDCRAKKTSRILESLGYTVIQTPYPLKNTNRRNGSLRCITAELPADFNALKFRDQKICMYSDIFWDSRKRLLVKPSYNCSLLTSAN
jgi:hypothetical protein